MADKTIGDLPVAESINDTSLIPMEQNGEAMSLTGGQLRTYAENAGKNAATGLVKGEKGDKGDKGDTGDVGPQGPQGEQGKNFTILGYYGSLSALQSAHPAPSAGDAYGVGTAAPYSIYIWGGVNAKWVDNGSMQDAVTDIPQHAETHAADGSDPVTPESIGAAKATYGTLTVANLLDWADSTDISGSFVVNPSYTTSGVPSIGYYLGELIVNSAGVAKTIRLISNNFHVTYQNYTENGAWMDEWETIATGDISLDGIGAVAADGSVPMTGDLQITKVAAPSIRIDQTNVGSRVLMQSLGHSFTIGMFNAIGDLSNGRSLYLRDSAAGRSALSQALELYDNASKVFYQLFGTHNRPVTVTTYTGTGTAEKSITVPSGTKMVIIQGSWESDGIYNIVGPTVIAEGQTIANVAENMTRNFPGVDDEPSYIHGIQCALSGTTCKLTMNSAYPLLNDISGTYHVIAI